MACQFWHRSRLLSWKFLSHRHPALHMPCLRDGRTVISLTQLVQETPAEAASKSWRRHFVAPCGTNVLLSSHQKHHEIQAIEATLQRTLLPDLPKAHDAHQNRVVNHLSGKLKIGHGRQTLGCTASGLSGNIVICYPIPSCQLWYPFKYPFHSGLSQLKRIVLPIPHGNFLLLSSPELQSLSVQCGQCHITHLQSSCSCHPQRKCWADDADRHSWKVKQVKFLFCPLESWVLISDARLQYTSTARQWAICRQAYKLIYKLYKSHWPRVPHCLLSNKHAMMQEWDGEKNVAIYLDLSS